MLPRYIGRCKQHQKGDGWRVPRGIYPIVGLYGKWTSGFYLSVSSLCRVQTPSWYVTQQKGMRFLRRMHRNLENSWHSSTFRKRLYCPFLSCTYKSRTLPSKTRSCCPAPAGFIERCLIDALICESSKVHQRDFPLSFGFSVEWSCTNQPLMECWKLRHPYPPSAIQPQLAAPACVSPVCFITNDNVCFFL